MKRPLKPLEPRNLESSDPRCRRPRRVNHHFNWAAWDAGYGIQAHPDPTRERRRRTRARFPFPHLLRKFGSGWWSNQPALIRALWTARTDNRLTRKRARRARCAG